MTFAFQDIEQQTKFRTKKVLSLSNKQWQNYNIQKKETWSSSVWLLLRHSHTIF